MSITTDVVVARSSLKRSKFLLSGAATLQSVDEIVPVLVSPTAIGGAPAGVQGSSVAVAVKSTGGRAA